MILKELYFKNKELFQGIIGCCIFFLSVIIVNHITLNRRLKAFDLGVYSIGTVTNLTRETRSTYYTYEFYYRGLKRESTVSQKQSYKLQVGKRYFVLINPESPYYNNFIIRILPVPDSIIEAPIDGWTELPIPNEPDKIKNFLKEYY